MLSHWSFGRRVGAGFTLAGLVLVTLAAVGHQSTERLIDNNRWVDHTHQVRTVLADLLSLVKDLETGQRGYVISGDERFLEPYRTALSGIGPSLQQLRHLTADNANQQRRLDRLAPIVDTKLDELKRTIALRASAGFEPV